MQKNEFCVVGIGASAGGHPALKDFFKALPTDLPAAYVVVTHLLRTHVSNLDKIISRFTHLRVQRISGITQIRQGNVYVLPENVFVKIKQGFLFLHPRKPDTNINKSIDILFESLALQYKEKAIGVVLSGMGNDGSDGAQTIFKNNGDVIVQEPSTSQFDSMPWATIMKDHPEYILPPAELAGALAHLIKGKLMKVAS